MIPKSRMMIFAMALVFGGCTVIQRVLPNQPSNGAEPAPGPRVEAKSEASEEQETSAVSEPSPMVPDESSPPSKEESGAANESSWPSKEQVARVAAALLAIGAVAGMIVLYVAAASFTIPAICAVAAPTGLLLAVASASAGVFF